MSISLMSFSYKIRFSLTKQPKDLALSWKIDLDFKIVLEEESPCLITEQNEIQYTLSSFCAISLSYSPLDSSRASM